MYAVAAGMPVKAAIKDALNQWMDTDGDPLLTFLERRAQGISDRRAAKGKPVDSDDECLIQGRTRRKTKAATAAERKAKRAAATAAKVLRISQSPRFKPAPPARQLAEGA